MLKIIAYLLVVLTLSVADEELVSYFIQFFRKYLAPNSNNLDLTTREWKGREMMQTVKYLSLFYQEIVGISGSPTRNKHIFELILPHI
jgi:hypothetical protein